MPQKTTKPAPARKVGKSLADFRKAHDRNYIVPEKIEAALKLLGKNGWEYEGDFVKLAGISQTDISAFREQFADHVVDAPSVSGRSTAKRVWAGSVEFANTLRNPSSETEE